MAPLALSRTLVSSRPTFRPFIIGSLPKHWPTLLNIHNVGKAAQRCKLEAGKGKYATGSQSFITGRRYISSCIIPRGNTFKSILRCSSTTSKDEEIPSKCDVLIVGGGAMGSSIAYHLTEQRGKDITVVVVEADDTYKTASTVLSMGCTRQQFTVPENIQLSLYGRKFLKDAHHLLKVPDFDPPDVQFHPTGFLILAHDAGRDQLLENYRLQIDAGAKVQLLSSAQLKDRFPWMAIDGVALGVIGVENEGWFDPWTLLMGFRRKAISLGARYVQGKVSAINDRYNQPASSLNTAHITRRNGKDTHSIEFSTVILAAGAWSGDVGKVAGIGVGEGPLAVPIPVEPRKRYVYCVHAPDGPRTDCPILFDYTRAHFRPEASPNIYLCIMSPLAHQEPPTDNLDVDHDYFDNQLWPLLVQRVPSFGNLKVRGSWAGFYDYNTLDQNAIIGRHPVFRNLILATGFSGHGIQHAAGVGRAVMEELLYGDYRTINLRPFRFERILMNEPLFEKNIF